MVLTMWIVNCPDLHWSCCSNWEWTSKLLLVTKQWWLVRKFCLKLHWKKNKLKKYQLVQAWGSHRQLPCPQSLRKPQGQNPIKVGTYSPWIQIPAKHCYWMLSITKLSSKFCRSGTRRAPANWGQAGKKQILPLKTHFHLLNIISKS